MASPLSASQRQRFPSLARYLDALPNGLDSYSECEAKASLVRSMFDEHRLAKFASELPPSLAELILQPPPMSSWIPEVHLRAILRVIHDRLLPDRRDFIKWTYDAQKRLLGGPIYSLLFFVISVDRLSDIGPSRWARFHRGSTMTVEQGPTQGTVGFTFPPHLFDDLDLEASVAGIRVALELMVRKPVEFVGMKVGTTSSSALMRWR